MIELINQDGCTLEELASRSGVDSQTVNSWRSRKSPQLVTFEAMLNALGYRLTIVAAPDD
jgi:transcriptional regulator with XRE-family HTH domain